MGLRICCQFDVITAICCLTAVYPGVDDLLMLLLVVVAVAAVAAVVVVAVAIVIAVFAVIIINYCRYSAVIAVDLLLICC